MRPGIVTARAADTGLHGLIAEYCGSVSLAAEINRYLILFRARDVCHLRDAWTNYSRADDVPQHLAIVRPLLKSDADGAAAPWTAYPIGHGNIGGSRVPGPRRP